MTIALKDQEEYLLGSLSVRALHTPCHTRGHVLFYVTTSDQGGKVSGATGPAPLVFSGDTLFVGGCGRFFEGDASQSEIDRAGHSPTCLGCDRDSKACHRFYFIKHATKTAEPLSLSSTS